jgi:Protein of unknown function (DUF2975)
MKKSSIVFLQTVTILIGIVVLVILVRFPQTEGRAKNLDLLSIYLDPLIMYGYLASIAFFVGLFNVFKLLGFIGQNKVFSANSIKALRVIKYCAIVFCILIVGAAIFVKFSQPQEEDSAGFIAICILAILLATVVGTAASIFEKIWQNAIDIKAENDLTV